MNLPPLIVGAGLGLIGRRAEQQTVQCFSLKGCQGPEITHASKGRGEEYGDNDQRQCNPEAPHTEEGSSQHQENPINPQSVRKLRAGEG